MYKREREIHEDFIEMDHAKRTKKEPFYALAESIENMMGASGNDYKNKVEWNNIHEDTNFQSEIGKKSEVAENIIGNGHDNEAFKYNSICDRDRRRHMYF